MKKSQHYLPKAYLNFFATEGNNAKMIYAYFISQKKVKHVSTDDVCCRKFLYEHEIITDNSHTSRFFQVNVLEDSFVKFESCYAKLVRQIVDEIKTSNRVTISPKEREMFAQCFSIFQCRCPDFVRTSNYVAKECLLKKYSYAELINFEMPNVDENIINAGVLHQQLKVMIHPETGIVVNAFKSMLEKDKLCILRSETIPFITSDAPFVNIYSHNDNVEYDMLGMPITPNLFLAFIDTREEVNSLIDISDNEVLKINAYQLNRKAPTMFLSRDDILSDKNYKQEIIENDLLTDKEFVDLIGLSEDEKNFCSKANKYLFGKGEHK